MQVKTRAMTVEFRYNGGALVGDADTHTRVTLYAGDSVKHVAAVKFMSADEVLQLERVFVQLKQLMGKEVVRFIRTR
jgi:hypothetical protein